MKINVISALLIVLSAFNSSSQSLPDEMYFSPDGRILNTGGIPHTGFYNPSDVKTIELYFSQSNYWATLQSNYASKTDLDATAIINGITYDSVGVRFRGMTSYMGTNNSDKKSFNITLDAFIDGKDVNGYNILNLNNSFQDPSFMREVFYQNQIRKHIPSAKSSYVKLYINGANWGVYPNVQQLNKDYLKEWFLNNDGTNWRADRPTGGGGPGWGDGTAALNYHTNDTSDYQTYYTLKSSGVTNPWEDLVDVCHVLDTVSSTHMVSVMNNYMDLDRTLWFLGSEIMFADDDSYVYKGKMDYYTYYDVATGRMTPLEYDGNSSMEIAYNSWSPFYNQTNANYPLQNKLFAQPEIRQRYLAHLRTLISEELDSADAIQTLTTFKNLIDTMVSNDPKKLYTYTQFNTEFNDLKNWIVNRKNYLMSNAEVNKTPPSISDVSYISNAGVWSPPVANENVTVIARATSTSGIDAVNLYYATGIYGKFDKMQMFDDGAHGDSSAADGIYGALLPGQSSGQWVRFYIEAIVADAAHTVGFSPVGAEHNVYIFQVIPSIASNINVTINEVMASNTTTAADTAGEYDDWIELYNLTSQPQDISGYYLTDNTLNLTKWSFPAGTIIPANGYLIVWADEDGGQGDLHLNFKLSGDGEHVLLLNANLEIVDDVTFGLQTTDLGYARVPNGTGAFTIQAPTFSASNNLNTGVDEIVTDAGISVYPNPASGYVKIYLSKAAGESLEIFNSFGQQMVKEVFTNRYEINVSDWANGLYFIRSGKSVKRFVVCN